MRIKFRLRTLFLVVGITASVFAVVAAKTADARKRWSQERNLRPAGVYSCYFDEDNNVEAIWLRGRLVSRSLSSYKSIQTVTVAGSDVRDRDLLMFATLPNLRIFDASNTALTSDAFPILATMKKLEWIRLLGAPVTDDKLESLASLPNLKGVDLKQTSVSQEALERFNARCPEVYVRGNAD